MIKLGSRVRVLHNDYGLRGRVGTVVGQDCIYNLVLFDGYHNGHNGDEQGVTYLDGYSYDLLKIMERSCLYFVDESIVAISKINFPNRKTIEQVKEALTYDYSEEID